MFKLRLTRRLALSLAMALGMLLAARPALAQPEVDEKSKEVLAQYGKFYSGLEGFKVKVTIKLEIEQKGQKQSQEFVQQFAAAKPNKFSYALNSDQGSAQIVSDGKEVSVYLSAFKKFAVESAPETFNALFQNPIILGSIGFGNAGGVMVSMLSDIPVEQLLSGAQKVEYGGEVELDGHKCHVIKATQEQFDWELWIDAGEQPLVRQFVPDLTKAFERLAKSNGGDSPYAGMKISNTVSYTNWDINPKFDEAVFAFNAPEDADPVDSLMELITGQPSDPAPHALVGKPAPQIELELLEGGHLNLESLRGEKIVILDFWATWCGPCVRAMPVIEKVAAKYADQGVALYAVNLREEADDIKAFIEENKLPEVKVALDKDGKVGNAYLATAIPQTVIVGKDGKVQVVKVGLSANLEESLGKDLEDLLAGKDLAAQTLAEAEQKAKERAEKKAKRAEAAKDAAARKAKEKKAEDASAPE
jgi:peroxiredoxin